MVFRNENRVCGLARVTHLNTDSAGEQPAPVILQVLPRLVTGGVERGTVEVAAALQAAGWKAVVASEGGPMVRELDRVGALHVTLPMASKNPCRLRANTDALRSLIREHGVSLVHVRSRAPGWAALRAARSEGVPLVTTFHGTYNLGLLGIKRPYNKVMVMGDRVIAISRFIRGHILDHYLPDDGPVRVIHRGVDISRFDPDRVSAERMIQLSRKWRLSDGEPVIMLPGRLTRWKGQLLLIDALSRLKDRRFRCILVGSDQGRTSFRRKLERAVIRAGLEDRVLLAGECNDMPAAYMVSDVVVSASTDPEAFGRVCAEGQAMGRPVVAPDHGAAPEIVEPGRTGWLFAPGHADSLAAALAECLDLDAAQRLELSARAIAHVREQFTTDAMCRQTLDVYRELLGR
ncbi:glycosyltransferase family 4 protein [Haematospirillum jordaniae]|nr:glycosyltransferase family 4 protein [Haematospirillum jordaniae]NKD58846.1 glycosyltransferase family 4 protein [Haematospirillum jordaniae]NKD66923.1 glycosyltransferase family 4 protein [Haematospirillum jordaniae]NKD78848.1 glycosyltransferase family 4 protein [Haematospirillum jordaniae]NKD80913.1 glycosyltransferase family 4 protein [Haematospirillum jordaniae]